MTDCRIVPLQIDLVSYREPTRVEDRDGNASKMVGSDARVTPRLDDESDRNYDEIIDCIVPPRRWEDGDGAWWMQKASNRSADRMDVAALTRRLETSLRLYQARDTGVCPTRRALYSQCFDEILRQVTVNCAERGLLLLKIRDELKTTMDAHRTVYESNVKRVGLTKPVSSVEPDVRNRIARLEVEKQKLERDLATSHARYETVQSRENEKRAVQQRRHDEKMEFLKRSNRNLKAFLEELLALE